MTAASSLLVLGGARSGKSRYAQARAEAAPGPLLFVATAQPWDDEMAERIRHHRADRGARWETVEEPLHLADIIAAQSRADRILLIDCLTLWASNLLHVDADIPAALDALADAMEQAPGPLILVSNEVGLGIVPDNALARRFRDVAGRINQRIAAIATEVQFLAAGLPLRLK